MANSTADLILRHTIVAIEAQGESSVRVKELADEVGVAVTSLYHFYGSREGLIEAAQGARYAASLREIADEWDALVRPCRTQRELRARIRRQLLEADSSRQADQRMVRINVVGSAHRRPRLADAIAAAQHEFVTIVAGSVAAAQMKGWVRSDLDLHAFASWYLGQLTSRALIELGPTGVDGDSWNVLAADAVGAVLFGDVPSALTGRPTFTARA